MSKHAPLSPSAAGLPVAAPSTALDAHGRSADDYDWLPVRRQPRGDGWSADRQRSFIEALADGGSVTEAARQVGMSASGAYRLRRSPGGEAFAQAWDAAIHQAALHLVDVAFDRAIHGSDEPVFDREGRRIGRRLRQNDRLLMFLLRAHLPERYAPANRDTRPASAPPPTVTPVAAALTALTPPAPDQPEALMAPDALARALDLADRHPGTIPPRWRDRDGPADVPDDAADEPLGAAFEAALDDAKREADAPPPPPDLDWDDELADDVIGDDDEREEDGPGDDDENGALA